MVEIALVIGFLTSVLAIGIGAATSTCASLFLWAFEACCLIAIGLVAILELRPRVRSLLVRTAALRHFREQLDALPEVAHPLDQVTQQRSDP